MTACASLRPKGGFGRGPGGQFGAALMAFRTCMAAHGETIPATRPSPMPTARPAGTPASLTGSTPPPRGRGRAEGLRVQDPGLPPARRFGHPRRR